MEVSVEIHTSAAFPGKRNNRYSLNKRPRGSKILSGPSEQKENHLPFPGNEPRIVGRSTFSLVTILTDHTDIPVFANKRIFICMFIFVCVCVCYIRTYV